MYASDPRSLLCAHTQFPYVTLFSSILGLFFPMQYVLDFMDWNTNVSLGLILLYIDLFFNISVCTCEYYYQVLWTVLFVLYQLVDKSSYLIVFLINIPSKIVQFIFLQANENIFFQKEKFLDFCGEGQSIVFNSFIWIWFFQLIILWALWEREKKEKRKKNPAVLFMHWWRCVLCCLLTLLR